ncbi:CAF17-like 4Fe-4S cluster assembly/insertion protein YgfZ [Rhodalgimonas zhirmunskyi]|uniref:Folate-binding protein n=1 Tax=Rhodalgimonas zhirmunskyi TaxID=2964767 RepID=A0AAJ1X6K0_9RHOB|nr:folate-binding protein [Rhodoalgimonas zhirmunskyi]MDQ2095586.1 folate-binding protein [Rhodoalgimonas zhirmunskyi]
MKRAIYRITGPEREHFLQGLVSNDVRHLANGLVYAALLTPQGKYLADFFLAPAGDAILLDIDATIAPATVQRLSMYKLRADVAIEETALHLHRGTDAAPEDGFADPRHPTLGWRAYRDTPQTDDTTDWAALRVAHVIPETGIELTPDSFILEMGFERLHGVDFRKGCYVGQEVTARMKHKTELRKGLGRIRLSGPVAPGTELTANGKTAGTVHTVSGDHALAYLRYDRAEAGLMAGDVTVTWEKDAL